MEQQIVKNHRVGTVTFGALLVLFGVLFLLRLFIPALSYNVIFRAWPCIFIFLGLEVLAGNYKAMKLENAEEKAMVKFVYDKTAIFLMVCLSFFAMIMATVDYCLTHTNGYWYF